MTDKHEDQWPDEEAEVRASFKPEKFNPSEIADFVNASDNFKEGCRRMLANGRTPEELAAELYAVAGEMLPAFTLAEAEGSLTPDEMEDKRLVTCIKGIGPAPRLKPIAKNGPYALKLGPQQKIWFCKFIAEMPSPALAAKMLGCSRQCLYDARKRDKDFARAWDAAKEVGLSQIDDAITEEALGFGVQHHVTKDGGILTIPKERNEKILLAYLNLHNAERLNSHKVEVDHSGGVVMIPKPFTPEEFEKVVFDQQQRHRDRKLPPTHTGATIEGESNPVGIAAKEKPTNVV